ncbi:plasminogen-like isoform X3 [Apteryx rowi]|uniref:plasminogen-like isoform X3 n=1 Tax=Apteryx rowi TaxID=308060 RepID=UPI000E1E27B7|nr:plasminogen-like isoform X3 [Apteryx rowi]XP_025922285.1 plasminogen-like isoform X3 [Apteryx rowi]
MAALQLQEWQHVSCEATKYCRNPDGDINGPWCYTTDPQKIWEYCETPKCAPFQQECGKPKRKPKQCQRIVGGCTSVPHSWTWEVSLMTSTNMHLCGDTLIDPQWILIAAQCLERSSTPSSYRVFLGLHMAKAVEPSVQIREVKGIFQGPYGADIALLKLSSPAMIVDQVIPVCLPEENLMVGSGTECFATGWGEIKGRQWRTFSLSCPRQVCPVWNHLLGLWLCPA